MEKTAAKAIGQWTVDWMHGPNRCTSPRVHLAAQLRYLIRHHSFRDARLFRDSLHAMSVFPTKPV